MKSPRRRAAHLGRVQIGAELYTVIFRNGWLHFRRYRSRNRVESIQLADMFLLARRQGTFAITPP